jgi:hypothetical protein
MAEEETHRDQNQPNQAGQQFDDSNDKVDKPGPSSTARSNPCSGQSILLVLPIGNVAQHSENPIRFQPTSPPDEVIGEQSEKEGGGSNAKWDQEEWDMLVLESRGEPDHEDYRNVEEGGDEGRQEEQEGWVGELPCQRRKGGSG